MSRIARALATMAGLVTDLVFGADGTATGKGIAEDDDTMTVGWHFGFSSRPLDGASGVIVKLGGRPGMSLLVGYRNRQYEVALEKGEVAVYNEAGAVSKWDKNGKISHTAKAGQIVAANGEDYAAPKTEDLYSALATFFNEFATAAPIVITSSGNPSTTLTTAANTVRELLQGASLKSTKFKYG